MVRWNIIRTLLYKEMLRYRYNWGLLVVVFALIALAGLVSIGSRHNKLPGQTGDDIIACIVYHRKGADDDWVKHLQSHPPEFEANLQYRPYPQQETANPWLPPGWIAIQLMSPEQKPESRLKRLVTFNGTAGTWKACYWHADEGSPGLAPYRDWFVRETRSYLSIEPVFEEETRKARVQGGGPIDRVPLLVTAMIIFALYLMSFNLYITSTGEEREKRVLLGLLLAPVSPAEMITAKAIFYATSSLIVSMSVAVMYQPRLLFNPMLWGAILAGSLGYVAIGTIVVSVVRRQTTINTVSMLYLMMTAIIIFLAQVLPLFGLLRLVMMENWLYSQIQQVVAGEIPWRWMMLNQIVLTVTVLAWTMIAIRVFARHAATIGRAR